MRGFAAPALFQAVTLVPDSSIYFEIYTVLSMSIIRALDAAVHGRLEGKVAIITGGAGGIGAAAARLFAKNRAKVIIADIADETGQKLAETLSPSATFVHCDVTKERDVSSAVDVAIKNHGQLDIMFNNAGTIDFQKKSVAEYDMENFQTVMDVNVKGVMHGIKHAARVMIPTQRGCILSTASIGGIMGGTTSHAYTASKHAVIGLTKNGAAELGKYGVRVNCVALSGVATDLAVRYFEGSVEENRAKAEEFFNSIANLKGVTLKEEDIAEAALYLASDEASYVSGHTLVVDGGHTVVNHDWKMYRP